MILFSKHGLCVLLPPLSFLPEYEGEVRSIFTHIRDEIYCVTLGLVNDFAVNLGCLEAAVAEELRHGVDIRPVGQQEGCIRVAGDMKGDVLGDICGLCPFVQAPVHSGRQGKRGKNESGASFRQPTQGVGR